MPEAVLDAVGATLSTLARLKLNAELAGLVKKKTSLPTEGPMAGLQLAKVAADIIGVLKRLGIEFKPAVAPQQDAFALEGGAEQVEQPRVVTERFFEFDPDRKTSQRRKDNAEAMRILKAVDKGDLAADEVTDEQKVALARYSGTGGNLVGADGKKGSAYEYYTPKPLASGIWDLLGELGFTGGKVGDPCSGVGIFGATAPANVAMETIELNETSGKINQLVNGGPGYSAVVSPFEAVASRTPDEIWDAVITNVPFGTVHDRGSNRLIDPKYQDQPLEAYFILRSLEKLKPGGLAAFIVPPRVVSGKGGREEQLRIAASYMAEFRGAYRLPNSVFGTADADTITDVIVFRKFGRDALTKVEELKEQNPAALVTAKVQWTEFIAGDYFRGEGKRFVLGEFQAKDPAKFRDVDRIISGATVPEIAKMLRKFPDSRIDWAALDLVETNPIIYAEGDTMTMAGQTLEMRDGGWVALGKSAQDDRYAGVGPIMATPVLAQTNKVTWAQARDYVGHLLDTSQSLDLPDWLRSASRDISKLDDAEQPKHWGALLAGLAAVEVSQHHGAEIGFNYLEHYPALSEALQLASSTAKRRPAGFSPESKAALVMISVIYDRKAGFSPVWRGDVQEDVLAGQAFTADAQVSAIKYKTQGIHIEVAALKEIYGEDFDPHRDDDWCLNGDGSKATRADDYYTGNLGDFLGRLDGEIAAASGALRDKLLRQKTMARERVTAIDPASLRFNLFTPFATIEEKAEFLRRFMHPAFVVAHDDDGEKVIICDIGSPKTERERQFKRFAEYLKRGNLSTRTAESEALANPKLDELRRKMLREMAATAGAQFDQWVKANPVIMDRLRVASSDPARLYFNEVDDTSALAIEGMNPDMPLHGYQNAEARKRGRYFGGINGFDVGLGKTLTALACAQYVQSIGVKKKTAFVVPNAVLSKWRAEAGKAYLSLDDCLFIGLDLDEVTGDAEVRPSNYARDMNVILQNRHRKIFFTLEAFKMVPLKDETISAYERHLSRIDPAFTQSERSADSERAESKLAEAIQGTGQKSSAIPFFEDMGIDSLVMDEAHMFKNSKNTVDFSGAKFLSVAEASQRGLDIQMKAWYVRGLSPIKDGVLALTATPITNSPLEIYSMLCLAVGEEKVHDLTMGAKGADEFMEVMCDVVDDEETTIDGRLKPCRVYRGLQNVALLRSALSTVATIKTGADVKAAGDDLRLPDAPEHKMQVQLGGHALGLLRQYKMAYRAARWETGAAARDAEEPTPQEMAALDAVLAKYGEPMELVAHPFNLINKMTMVIADPELDERATFYKPVGRPDLVQTVIAAFNKLGRIEVRKRPGPWTQKEAILGAKKVKDGDGEVQMVRIKVLAQVAPDGRIAVDTMDTNTQGDFERLADKAGLILDASVPPKLAALLENVRKEEAHPRSASGRVKQLIFCDLLPLHNKIKRLLIQHAGVPAAQVVIVSGQTIQNPEQMQTIQDTFNSDHGPRYVIGNEKIEVGVDLQKGTQAVHHITTGWTPDSTHQRDGRAVRQGNTTGSVNRYHYHADGTFDAYKLNLTTKKGDWIGAVMDQRSGNDVAVAGGLTNDQYDEMIESMGDAAKIAGIQQRAAVKERAARSEAARARQAINLRTAQTQREFVKQYDKPKEWLVRKGLQLFDLRRTQATMTARVNGRKMTSTGLLKVQTRLAEVNASIEALVQLIDSSATFKQRVQYTPYSTVREYEAGILATLDESTGYSVASRVREAIESRLRHSSTLKEGSELEQEWQVEIASAEKMAAEALGDFARLAQGPDHSYPEQILTAFESDQATVADGMVYARGMFARDKAGNLLVMHSGTALGRFPHDDNIKLDDALARGYKFIMFGSDEYEAAVNEAAALDDAAEDVTDRNMGALFGAVVPEVALRRQTATLVRYRWQEIRLPAPFFPYVALAEQDGVSEAFKALAASQTIVAGIDEKGEILIDSGESISVNSGYVNEIKSKTRMSALYDYAVAHGVKFNIRDFAAIGDSWASSFALGEAKVFVQFRAKWGDYKEDFAECSTLEELAAAADRVLKRGFEHFLVLPEGAQFGDWAPFDPRYAYDLRAKSIQRDAELAEMAKAQAEAEAKRAAEAALAPPPAPEPGPIAEQAPAPVSVEQVEKAGIRLAPWASGKTGEKRIYFNGVPGAQKSDKFYAFVNSDNALVTVIKAAANEAGLRATIQQELTAMNGGVPVTTFERLYELAGVVLPPADTVQADADGIVGLAGETKANMAIIKSAAIAAGGRAFWMGSKNKLQWNVPAKAWQIIQQNHPQAAQALYAVPA